MYTRASASDYDDWEKLYSNPGWGSADLLQYLKKVHIVLSVMVGSLKTLGAGRDESSPAEQADARLRGSAQGLLWRYLRRRGEAVP